MIGSIKFYVKDIARTIKSRQINEFDSRIAIAGNTGDGKSTLGSKIMYKVGKFRPWKHQVYSRGDVINLLKTQIRGKCFDDEAINSGYKRNWQDKGQQELIKILTNYRDSYNLYISALPNFFSLDKDLRDLFFMLLHVVERGIAVVHLPIEGNMYSQDKWDAKNNAKIEQKWNEKRKKNPNFRVPYHKLSTFAGYLYFTKLTEKQEKLYKEVKRVKRAVEYEEETKEESFNDKVYKILMEGKLSQQGLMEICLMNGKKYSSICSQLNGILKDNGEEHTLTHFFRESSKDRSNNSNVQIKTLVPDFSLKSI